MYETKLITGQRAWVHMNQGNRPNTGKTMAYNLMIPTGYDGSKSFPLVLFMADASTVGKDVTAPLTQGYGALEFASDRDQVV